MSNKKPLKPFTDTILPDSWAVIDRAKEAIRLNQTILDHAETERRRRHYAAVKGAKNG